MNFSLDFNVFFNLLMTGAIGYICYSLKERETRNEKRHEKHESAIKDIKQDLDRNFVTKDEHYRNINALDKKIDDIKSILMTIKEDIGKLVGGQNE